MASVLDGVRVVDLSCGVAGPVTGMLLADHGAEVVKVEPPGGDPFRGSPGYDFGCGLAAVAPAHRDALAVITQVTDPDFADLEPWFAARTAMEEYGFDRAEIDKLIEAKAVFEERWVD